MHFLRFLPIYLEGASHGTPGPVCTLPFGRFFFLSDLNVINFLEERLRPIKLKTKQNKTKQLL